MNPNTKIRLLFACLNLRAWGRAMWDKIRVGFGARYRVRFTFCWPNRRPEYVTFYCRAFTSPRLGLKTTRGYLVAWDVTHLSRDEKTLD